MERPWAIALQRTLSKPKLRAEFHLLSRENWPEVRRKRDLYELECRKWRFKGCGLKQIGDIRGKRPCSAVFWNSQVLFGPPEKGEKGRFLGGQRTHKHKQLLGIVPGMGGGQIGLCVALFWGEKGNTQTKFPRFSGKCRDSPGTIPG